MAPESYYLIELTTNMVHNPEAIFNSNTSSWLMSLTTPRNISHRYMVSPIKTRNDIVPISKINVLYIILRTLFIKL